MQKRENWTVNAHLDGVRGEIGALQRTIWQAGGGMIGVILIGFVGLVVSHA